MPLAEHDDMIKAFPSDRANQPFRMAILPWRAWRSWPVANAHGTKPPGENLAIDPVAIADEVAWVPFPPQASVSCRAIHSALGCAVTPSHRIWRRPCRRISKP